MNTSVILVTIMVVVCGLFMSWVARKTHNRD